ncbi:MAG TPA: MurT ligase domain-containing protein [Solirubrobacterales bacterium]|jgi:UDP-N-acetylmuramyl tripeptide synthase
MGDEGRDRLLRAAWAQPPLGDRVATLSKIAQQIGPDPGSRSAAPADLPDSVRSLAAAARDATRARGGGATALPGKVALESAPDALRVLARRLPEGCVLVSGTNGKTTAASMLASILRVTGREVVHNRAGANAHWGVATALLEGPGDIGVFEVDEAWLPILAAELAPRVIVLGNLFRDRLDAYGDIEALTGAWLRMIAADSGATLVLNSDDSTIAHLATACPAARRRPPIFFGVEDRSLGLAEAEHTADSIRCPACETPLHFELRLLSHLGHYRCDGCDARRPEPEIRGEEVALEGLSEADLSIEAGGQRIDLRLGVPGLYNVYNALAATAAAHAIGVDPISIADGLGGFAPVFGRGERVQAGDTDLLILLMKNPAGANELMRMLGRDGGQGLDLLILLNDGPADGRDVSWIWDADFELLADRIGRATCGGSRAAELALRLKYAGWPVAAIEVDECLSSALDRSLADAPDRLIALPTYSALLALHGELERRGLTPPYWAAPTGAPAPSSS